jgi:hypothetical protein
MAEGSIYLEGKIVSAVKDGGSYWTPIQQYSTSANASSTPLVITSTPTSSKKIVIDDLLLSCDTDMTATFRTTTTQTTIAKLYLTAKIPMQITFRCGLRSPDANKQVEILTSASGNITATCSYHSE